MSCHTFIHSNITDFDSLVALLKELSIEWFPTAMWDEAENVQPLHAISAVIAGERIVIYQNRTGEAFRFGTHRSRFRNESVIREVAKLTSAEDATGRQNAQGIDVQEVRRANLEPRKHEQRQRGIADEAADILRNLNVQQRDLLSGLQAEPAYPARSDPESKANTATNAEGIIGKLRQTHALRRIRDHLPELRDKFGVTLGGEERLDDETIELKLVL